MSSQKYELVFRMPEDVFRMGSIEAMNAGGYGEMNFVFIHGVPDLEIYASQASLKRAGLKGFKLYADPQAVDELIEKGDNSSRVLHDFFAGNPIRNFKTAATTDLYKFVAGIDTFWAPFNTVYNYTEFVYFTEIERRLREWIGKTEKDPGQVSEMLHLVLSDLPADKVRRTEAIRSLGLPHPLQNACNSVVRISAKKMAWRKTLNKASQYSKLLCREIARRFYMSPKQAESCLSSELVDLFTGKGPDVDVLNARGTDFVVVGKNRKLKILLGKQAARFKAEHIPSLGKDIKEFRGDVVCAGKARGKAVKFSFGFSEEAVRIINQKIKVMKPGDIVVAGSTGPELIMACRKAGAIITEEGGINSHAAVISRELKIPAIVNTKIATQVIDDGDLIEVDANAGIVRILQKQKS